MTYAKKTKVAVDSTISQIRKALTRAKATDFGYAGVDGQEQIAFRIPSSLGIMLDIRYRIPTPSLNDFARTPTGRLRSEETATELWEQAVKAEWRLAHLSITTKLHCIAQGHSLVEREFFYDTVIPGTGGRTAGEVIAPQLERAYHTKQVPTQFLLSGPKE